MANQAFIVTVPDIHQGPGYLWWNTLAPGIGARMLVDGNGNPQNPASSTWVATTPYSVGQEIWDGTNIEICAVTGTSGSSAPTWPAVGGTVTDGGVAWYNMGPPVPLGASEGTATFHLEAKLEEVAIDQETAPVDAVMTAESAYIEFTLKESAIKKIAYALAHASYSSGTDSGLPAGAQSYEQLDVGGLIVPSGANTPRAAGCYPCVSLISPRRGFSAPGKFMVATLYAGVPKDPHQIGFTRAKEAVYKVRFDGLAQLWRTQGKRVAQFYRQT